MSDKPCYSPEQSKAHQPDLTQSWSNASAQIYAESKLRWGQDRVNQIGLDKTDPAETLYLLMMGPELYKQTGNIGAHRLGMAAIEFGIAPLMGGAETAQRQYASDPMGVFKKGSTDTLVAASIGTAENFVPAIKTPLRTLMLGGLALDQISPKNLTRDRELINMASHLDSNDSKLMAHDAQNAARLLGPLAYDAGMIVATGNVGYRAAITTTGDKAECAGVKDALGEIAESIKAQAPILRDRLLTFCKNLLPDSAGGALSKEEFATVCSVYNAKGGAFDDPSKRTDFELLKDVIPVSQKLLKELTQVQSELQRNPSSKFLQTEFETVQKRIETEKKLFLDTIKDYLKKNSRDPESVLVQSMQSARVLGLGDVHLANELSPNRELQVSLLKDLKEKGGATHFAIELPKSLQPFIDQFSRSSKGSDFVIPDQLSLGESVSPADASALRTALIKLKDSHPEWIKFLKTARDNDLKIVCCDDQCAIAKLKTTQTDRQRETTIAKSILSVLAEDPNNKVVGLFGALHWGKPGGWGSFPCAGQLIRNSIGRDQVVTVVPQLGDGGAGAMCSLYPFARALTRPAAISTKMGVFNSPIAELPFVRQVNSTATFKDFDWVMMYPPSSK